MIYQHHRPKRDLIIFVTKFDNCGHSAAAVRIDSVSTFVGEEIEKDQLILPS